jgi:transcription elongation factor Elf1
MKQKDYIKAVIEKINPDRTITCEDCGDKDMIGHMIIDHQAETVKAVCHSCFVTKYQSGLYGKEYKA